MHTKTAWLSRWLGGALVALVAGVCYATVFYSDGLVHDISGPAEDIWVVNGTTLNVLSGAEIESPILSAAIVVGDGSSVVNVFGGSIRGGDNNGVVGQSGGNAIEGSGTVRVYGGVLRGGDVTGPGTGIGGGGILIVGGTVEIQGGSLIGADKAGGGGGYALALRDAVGSISGGSFSAGGGANVECIRLGTATTLDLSGGSFSGFFSLDGAVLNVYGSELAFGGNPGDYLTGTLSEGTPISVQVYNWPGSQVNLLSAEPEVTPEVIAGELEDIGLPAGTESSLGTKLASAQASLDAGKTVTAINQLQAFINQLQALSGKKLSQADADALIEMTETLIAELTEQAGLAASKPAKIASSGLTVFPNPANPATTIRYTLENDALVKLEVYNLLGQRIRELANEIQGSGMYSIRWDGLDSFGQAVGSGVYLIRFGSGEKEEFQKVLLLK